MASITDKFGRPSAVTGYANPTTVRTARLAGETTLSAYDLSGFDDTTPLYFVTYKKTTEVNPNTGLQEEKIVNQVSFKGIVNLDNNTITDLEVSPGYSDLGNEAGDYIESVPTSRWGNDLVGGLLVSHKPDGTHKPDSILSLVYPVGSLYFNATNGTNPGTLLGFGTWVAFGAGRVPVGFDSGQTEFNSAGKTGGAKTHTLTAAQMPSHDHEIGASGQSFVVSGNPGPSQWASGASASSSFALRLANRTSTAGGGGAHNNLQPYITVYIWRRTA